MSIYRFMDYRDVIIEAVESAKDRGIDLTFTALSKAIGVQSAYMSRVNKKDAHLSSDQVYLAAEHLQFNHEEAKYLLLLLEFCRSSILPRRKMLETQIKEIQMSHIDTKNHINAKAISPLGQDEFNQYYLDPLAPLVHTFLTIPRFSKDLNLILKRIQVSEKRLQETIKRLEDLDVIKWVNQLGYYQVLQNHLHLSKESQLNLTYQMFQRTQALQKISSQGSDEKYVFSVLFSCDEKSRSEIHEEFLKFLKKTEIIVRKSPSSDVYQINFDLFGWT